MAPELPFKPERVEMARTLLESDWIVHLLIFFKCTLMGFQGSSVSITIVDRENAREIKLILYIKNTRRHQRKEGEIYKQLTECLS